jgi:hypothetical protein
MAGCLTTPLTPEELIRKIHFGGMNGALQMIDNIRIDNLTIGNQGGFSPIASSLEISRLGPVHRHKREMEECPTLS